MPAEHYLYGPLKDKRLCDANVPLKLQLDARLTLKTAITAASQSKMVLNLCIWIGSSSTVGSLYLGVKPVLYDQEM